jgi:hypothetical protein
VVTPYLPLGFGLPALRMAIATACFWGFPAATSVLIFDEIAFFELPLLRGIVLVLPAEHTFTK